jgi:hypothetical protein
MRQPHGQGLSGRQRLRRSASVSGFEGVPFGEWFCPHQLFYLGAPYQRDTPTRTPRSGRRTVPVWYLSQTMGRVIKAASHTVAFASLQEAAYSDNALECYDQPPSKGSGPAGAVCTCRARRRIRFSPPLQSAASVRRFSPPLQSAASARPSELLRLLPSAWRQLPSPR